MGAGFRIPIAHQIARQLAATSRASSGRSPAWMPCVAVNDSSTTPLGMGFTTTSPIARTTSTKARILRCVARREGVSMSSSVANSQDRDRRSRWRVRPLDVLGRRAVRMGGLSAARRCAHGKAAHVQSMDAWGAEVAAARGRERRSRYPAPPRTPAVKWRAYRPSVLA
jgi:hypothetical protein